MKAILVKADTILSNTHNPVLVIVRFVMAFVFVQAGWGKLNNLSRTINYFESLNIPLAIVQAPMVAGLEIIGGVLILVGFMTRPSSLVLAFIMFVAILTAKLSYIGGISELFAMKEFLYLLILLMFSSGGAGSFSVDEKYKLFRQLLIISSALRSN